MCKFGEVYEQFEDSACVETIDQGSGRILLIESHKGSIGADERMMEINYSKCSVGRKGGYSNLAVSHTVPRYQVFKMSDSILDIKTKIYERCAPMFAETEVNEDWINTNIILMHKDSTPSMRSGGKMECEFCGRRHTARDDLCEISTENHNDANVMEAAKEIKL